MEADPVELLLYGNLPSGVENKLPDALSRGAPEDVEVEHNIPMFEVAAVVVTRSQVTARGTTEMITGEEEVVDP